MKKITLNEFSKITGIPEGQIRGNIVSGDQYGMTQVGDTSPKTLKGWKRLMCSRDVLYGYVCPNHTHNRTVLSEKDIKMAKRLKKTIPQG